MITSAIWLPRGTALPVPLPAPLTEDELRAMREQAADMAAGVLQGDDDGDGEPSSSSDGASSSDGWATDEDGAEDMDAEAAVAHARAAAAAIAGGSASKTAAKGARNGAAKGSGKSAAAAAKAEGIQAALAELDMEHYDDSDDDAAAAAGGGDGDGEASAAVVARALGGRGAGIILDDPYLDAAGDSDDDGEGGGDGLSNLDSEEADDYVLRDSDLLILAARTEDDVSTLEVWVYEEASSSTGGEANIYVHHDILLPALPLSLAWMDVRPAAAGGAAAAAAGARANMVAVGSMDPGIELWDLDVADAVEPAAVLGGYGALSAPDADAALQMARDADGSSSASKGAKKKAKAKAKKAAAKVLAQRPLRPGSHSDAVMALAWNGTFRNVLASGSADCAVKVWDVAACSCAHTLTHHTDKVQALAWNPAEAPVLLSGGFDRTACLADVRQPEGKALSWGVSADVEALAWNPGSPTTFLVSSEDGLVAAFDARKGTGSKPLFRLAAHNKAACVLSFCSAAPGLLATASTDKVVKLWDVSDCKPSMLTSMEPKLGAVFSGGFCADVPYLLAMAGAKGSVGVWDVRSSAAVAAKWPALMADAVAQPPPS